MSEFNPANALIRVGYESLPGIPPTVWWDHNMVSESFSNDAPTIQQKSITQAAQRPVGAPTKIGCAGDVNLEFDAESYIPYLASLQKKGAVTTVATGVYDHRLAPSETEETFKPSIGVEVWRDDDMAQILCGGRVNSLDFSLSPRNFLGVKAGVTFARSHYWGDPVEAVAGATPNTYKPILRGLPKHSNWTATDTPDLWMEITSIADIATGLIKAKAGYGTVSAGPVQVAPSPFPANEFNIYVGLDADGEPIFNAMGIAGLWVGDRAMPIEVYLSNSTGYEVGDRYHWPLARPIWVPTYPDVPVFNEIFANIYVDGVREQVSDFNFTLTSPVQAIEAIGGRFAWTTRTRGMREASVKLGKEYLSTRNRKRLESGTAFAFKLDAYTGNEFGAGYENELHINAANCVPGGKSPTVGGQADMKEEINATCHPDPGNSDGFVDDATFDIRNSIADITL